MKVWAGTSGYSYKEWKGAFYPEKLPAKKMLEFYAQHFATVEINNTFYKMPTPATFEKWASEVPDGFTFALKASQRITHIKRLKETDDSVRYLFETAAALGEKLGPVLVQLPPNLKANAEVFSRFLDSLPVDRKVAFEFRHASWSEEWVTALLGERARALCIADDEEKLAKGETEVPPRVLSPVASTADWGYLRLRRCDYTEAEVEHYAKAILAQPWSEAFVFFKHEDEATGPALAAKFLQRVAALSPSSVGPGSPAPG